jgi:hypothetical protein
MVEEGSAMEIKSSSCVCVCVRARARARVWVCEPQEVHAAVMALCICRIEWDVHVAVVVCGLNFDLSYLSLSPLWPNFQHETVDYLSLSLVSNALCSIGHCKHCFC